MSTEEGWSDADQAPEDPFDPDSILETGYLSWMRRQARAEVDAELAAEAERKRLLEEEMRLPPGMAARMVAEMSARVDRADAWQAAAREGRQT